MYPTFYSYGDLRFHSYTVMMTLAFLIGTIGPNWLNRRREHPFPVTPIGGIWVFLGGIAGAKIWWMVQYGDWEDLRYLRFFLDGGLVFFGGLFGGIVTGIIYLKILRVPVIPAADMVAPFMALAHGLGRIGCFLNGCCWGAVARFNLPWMVQFPKGKGPYNTQLKAGLLKHDDLFSLPVHPTQMYEVMGNVLIFIVLLFVYKKHKRTGVVALSYITLYGMLRFTTEIFRGDSARPVLNIFTSSQTVALLMFVFGLATFVICSKTVWAHPLAQPEAVGPEMQTPPNGEA